MEMKSTSLQHQQPSALASEESKKDGLKIKALRTKVGACCMSVCVFQRGDSSWHQMRSKQQDHTPEASVDLQV